MLDVSKIWCYNIKVPDIEVPAKNDIEVLPTSIPTFEGSGVKKTFAEGRWWVGGAGVRKTGEPVRSFHWVWNWRRILGNEGASESIQHISAEQTKDVVPGIPTH